MKRIIYSFIITILMISCSEQEAPLVEQQIGIKFEKFVSWDSLLITAKEVNKPIFIDCYASWCGPCKMMANTIFPDTTVGQYFNAHYLSYKIDMEKEGVDLMEKFDITGFPTFLFLSAEGIEMHRSGGYMLADEFINLAARAKDEDQNLLGFKTKFDKGNTDKIFLKDYATALYDAGLDFTAPVKAYLNTLNENDYFTQETFEFFLYFLNDIHAKETQFLLANKDRLIQAFGEEEYQMLMQNIAVANFRKHGRKIDAIQLQELKDYLIKNKIEDGARFAFEFELKYYARIQDWRKYEKLALAEVDKHYSEDAYELNNIAWSFYLHVNNKNSLLKAAEWVNTAVKMDESYAIMDTYACLLFKAEVYDQAKYAAMKAIEIGQKEGRDVSDTEELLKKIGEKLS